MRTTNQELTTDPVVLRILEQIKLQGRTEKEVAEAIGLSTDAFTRWKYKDSKSYMTHMGKIADYLNLTAEYLLDTEDSTVKEETLNDKEIRLLKMFRQMNIDKQSCLLSTAEYFLE